MDGSNSICQAVTLKHCLRFPGDALLDEGIVDTFV
jgi:hypothetical protein